MHKLFFLALILAVDFSYAKDHTWICKADFEAKGKIDTEKLKTLSREINQELTARKQYLLSQPCQSKDLSHYNYDIMYHPDTDPSSETEFEQMVQTLKNHHQIDAQSRHQSDPIILHAFSKELNLNSFDCIYSCQPPEDLQHIR